MRLPIKYEILFRGREIQATIDILLNKFTEACVMLLMPLIVNYNRNQQQNKKKLPRARAGRP